MYAFRVSKELYPNPLGKNLLLGQHIALFLFLKELTHHVVAPESVAFHLNKVFYVSNLGIVNRDIIEKVSLFWKWCLPNE